MNPTQLHEEPEPRYADYYGMLTYADFLACAAAGTLDRHAISTRPT